MALSTGSDQSLRLIRHIQDYIWQIAIFPSLDCITPSCIHYQTRFISNPCRPWTSSTVVVSGGAAGELDRDCVIKHMFIFAADDSKVCKNDRPSRIHFVVLTDITGTRHYAAVLTTYRRFHVAKVTSMFSKIVCMQLRVTNQYFQSKSSLMWIFHYSIFCNESKWMQCNFFLFYVSDYVSDCVILLQLLCGWATCWPQMHV